MHGRTADIHRHFALPKGGELDYGLLEGVIEGDRHPFMLLARLSRALVAHHKGLSDGRCSFAPAGQTQPVCGGRRHVHGSAHEVRESQIDFFSNGTQAGFVSDVLNRYRLGPIALITKHLESVFEKDPGRCTLKLWPARTEVGSQIPEARCAEESVGDGVENDVTIAVAR